MKKALFLDKALSSVRVPLGMQNLDTLEGMAAVTVQFLQHNAQHQAGVTVTPNNRRGPDDMEIDALTKKGKGNQGKGKPSKNDGQKTSCFVCGRVGHVAKDCWLEETKRAVDPTTRARRQRQRKEQCERSHDSESATTPSGGSSASQISRTAQDTDTGDRPVPMDEDEHEDHGTGYILTEIRHTEPLRNSKGWSVAHVLVGNCAGELVCSPRDFEWIATEPIRNSHLVPTSGHKLKHCGEQSVPMNLRDGRKMWITFQVREVNGPIMTVGKFSKLGQDRCATFTTRGGVLRHEEAGEALVDRVRNHHELECWIKPGSTLALVRVGGSSGSASDLAGHLAAAPQRADAEILTDVQPQELEILPVASFVGDPENPARMISRNTPCCMALRCPWCDICIQSKDRDAVHRQATLNVLPVIQFDDTHQGQPHFDPMVGTDMSTGAAWASTVLIIGKTHALSLRSFHAHGTVKRCHDEKLNM